MRQFRFVHLGVAAALSAAAVVSVSLLQEARASTPNAASSFVPIVPCRLADTRLGADHVGVHPAALGQGEVVVFAVWGANGNCNIPATATGIASNVTAVNPTANSFLTLYPADAATRPTASNLNWTPTSPPTPNQVTVGLSATGAISVFNLQGGIDVIIDVVGYYEPVASAPPAPVAISGRTTIATSAWSTSTATLWFSFSPNVANGWPARRATIAIPELTQTVLDSGVIEVMIQPDKNVSGWTPLPFTQPSGDGWNRQIEYRASVGALTIYFLHASTDDAAVQPAVSSANLPNLDVRWTLQPG